MPRGWFMLCRPLCWGVLYHILAEMQGFSVGMRILAAKTHKRHKRGLYHEEHEGHEVFFDRIYRMIGISAVEGAWRELRGNTLGIKAGCALSKRASSGPTRLDPATLSPCEACFRSESRIQESGGKDTAARRDKLRFGRRGDSGKWGCFLGLLG